MDTGNAIRTGPPHTLEGAAMGGKRGKHALKGKGQPPGRRPWEYSLSMLVMLKLRKKVGVTVQSNGKKKTVGRRFIGGNTRTT